MNHVSITAHIFRMGEHEDPEIYAAEPLYHWEHSEAGQWIMKNAIEPPTWELIPHSDFYGHLCIVKAKLSPQNYTYWKLKYD